MGQDFLVDYSFPYEPLNLLTTLSYPPNVLFASEDEISLHMNVGFSALDQRE